MRFLITGAAGFIGFHTAKKLLDSGHVVVGIDNLNEYYDVGLKKARLSQLLLEKRFQFVQQDIADRQGVGSLFGDGSFDVVIHLAAQAGVRYSLENPHAYLDSNLAGTLNILEGCRNAGIKHLVYASSSSIYGANRKVPFSESDVTDSPISLYAATKKANELMCYTYAHLYRMPCTGLRFFTVYGPWGRPDMAYFKFAAAIKNGKSIDVYNNGDMSRDFTYIDDIVDGIISAVGVPPSADEGVPHRVFNLGNSHPEQLMEMIRIIESLLGMVADKRYLPMQPGDVERTYADVADAKSVLGYLPKTGLEEGLKKFVGWYQSYYQ